MDGVVQLFLMSESRVRETNSPGNPVTQGWPRKYCIDMESAPEIPVSRSVLSAGGKDWENHCIWLPDAQKEVRVKSGQEGGRCLKSPPGIWGTSWAIRDSKGGGAENVRLGGIAQSFCVSWE